MKGHVLCQVGSCQRPSDNVGKKARSAGDGRLVCSVCLDRLVGDIRSLPTLYDDCMSQTGSGTVRVIRNRPRKSTTADPMSAAATEVRTAIRKVLASWASLVADERRLQRPPRDILELSQFLCRHAEWLAAHPAAAEIVDEIGELTRTARRVAYSHGGGRVPVGSCPTCSGELVAYMRRREDSLPAEIVCDTVPDHRWPATRWATLARAIQER